MKLSTLYLTAGIVWMGLAAMWHADDSAMKVCQLSHSHDICFATLHR